MSREPFRLSMSLSRLRRQHSVLLYTASTCSNGFGFKPHPSPQAELLSKHMMCWALPAQYRTYRLHVLLQPSEAVQLTTQ